MVCDSMYASTDHAEREEDRIGEDRKREDNLEDEGEHQEEGTER